ncbi:hypothetical protein B0H11DRAFT_2221304 [Mycena galericulata]|nr:hypothetical protein B0H11DRAFT_2221304 [Mycena galericulata]
MPTLASDVSNSVNVRMTSLHTYFSVCLTAAFFGNTQATSDAGTIPTGAATAPTTSSAMATAAGSSALPSKGKKTPQQNTSPGPTKYTKRVGKGP